MAMELARNGIRINGAASMGGEIIITGPCIFSIANH
jgi:hypothetical protein